jgi:hypothetical protein
MIVDVYHSGSGKTPRAPFVLVKAGADKLPDHPGGMKIVWNYWKQFPLDNIAVAPSKAQAAISETGYFVQ